VESLRLEKLELEMNYKKQEKANEDLKNEK
jgi:hypothetical protein